MLRCPVCQRDMVEPEDGRLSKYYPFCSDRCKLVDLSAWLDSRYVIQSATPTENPDVNDDGY